MMIMIERKRNENTGEEMGMTYLNAVIKIH
jgi:hypothetical protein